MPKSIHNSKQCICCHRFMPSKAGKRRTCTVLCRKAVRDESHRKRMQRRRAAAFVEALFAPRIERLRAQSAAQARGGG